MFDVAVELSVRERWMAACATLAEACRDGVQRAIASAVTEARSSHPYTDRTGMLTQSIGGQVDEYDSEGAEGYVAAVAPYASYVEEGTRPHEIRPKMDYGTAGPLAQGQSRRGRAETKAMRDRNRIAGRGSVGGRSMLAWEAPQGDWHFARVVHHPGTKPMPFMEPASQGAERALRREINRGIERVQLQMN